MNIFQTLAQDFKFVLVSQSPRRKKILQDMGIKFLVKPQDTPEKIRDYWFKKDIVTVAYEKLDACPCQNQQILIACDTIVVYRGKVLGKPKNKKQAEQYLTMLSNHRHTVYSCVAVKILSQNKIKKYHAIEKTDVWFRKLNKAEIAAYIATPEPYDKAGGYGMQDTSNVFVKRINGCYYNVIGLPLTALLQILNTIKGDHAHGMV